MKNDNHALKNIVKLFKNQLRNEFSYKTNISNITHKLVAFIDELIINLFVSNHLDTENDFCLLALGGYGRREMSLYSDIDILLLHHDKVSIKRLKKAQHFIQDCWDCGLEISHQITTVNDCAKLASQNVSVISSLLDIFLLCGRGSLYQELVYQIHPLHMWSSKEYFTAKVQEQGLRDRKYSETAYNLEPNIKYGVGGLRDLHILSHIGKRHFNINKLAEGISFGFITDKEYENLMYCQHFLWRVRFALHALADKAEERLSFDYQIKLAQFFNYKDKSHSLAIEQFMKDYFQVLKRNRELNEMLLQWFDETIAQSSKQQLISLDSEFQLSNLYLEVKELNTFQNNPSSLLKLFWWIATRVDIEGVRASTIRLVRESLHLVNDEFKKSLCNTSLFISILKSKRPYEALQFMSRYGVLGHYLDCFAQVSGQMQYDLFHVFTVDQHTLFVIRNISRFKQEAYQSQFALAAQIIKELKKPEILYLSALFHDIAKGRGGDHSELGAHEAANFAKVHQLKPKDSKLLVWLVKKHLLMSETAQRQDIYDPQTIKNFCALLPSIEYLDYLYLLTVADICGTNPQLWNAWKDSLLKELYRSATLYSHKEKELNDQNLLVRSRKKRALSLLIKKGFDECAINTLWNNFKDKYFLHESASIIAHHIEGILTCTSFPLIMIMPHHSLGGTEVFIYTPHLDSRFAISTTVLCNHHVTIQEAMILTTYHGFDIDTYIILDDKNQAFLDKSRAKAIQNDLEMHLNATTPLPKIARKRIPKRLSYFKVKSTVSFSEDHTNKQTRLFVVTADKPGLLALISRVFLESKIHLHNAKIVTAGERAEDTFYITNQFNSILEQEEKECLKSALLVCFEQ